MYYVLAFTILHVLTVRKVCLFPLFFLSYPNRTVDSKSLFLELEPELLRILTIFLSLPQCILYLEIIKKWSVTEYQGLL